MCSVCGVSGVMLVGGRVGQGSLLGSSVCTKSLRWAGHTMAV